MPKVDNTEINDIHKLLRVWDQGSKSARARLLQNFVQQNAGRTGPELESQFSNASSLFLTRLTAWLRLSYLHGTYLSLQLRAIGVFIGASSGHHYLTEFLEVGGILTSLEILGLKDVKEEDKVEAIKLLLIIANAGRRYKELICESYGVRAVSECLAKSQAVATQDLSRSLLQELSIGNPRYQSQIYKALISLLGSASPKAQQLAASTLRFVQSSTESASISIVEPTLSLLRSFHVEVQFEACELLKELMKYDVQQFILEGLVGCLRPTRVEAREDGEQDKDEEAMEAKGSVAVFVQQASAAKMIGILSRQSPEIAEACVQLGAISGLLYSVGNVQHAHSQKEAYNSLQFFIRSFPGVSDAIKDAIGKPVFERLLRERENFCFTLDLVEIEVLQNNKLKLNTNTR